MREINALIRRDAIELALSFPMWGIGGRQALCSLGRELSPETKLTSTLLMNFWPPELWENKSLLFKAPILQKQEAAVGQHQQSLPHKYPITNFQNKIKHSPCPPAHSSSLLPPINAAIALPVTLVNKPKTLVLHCVSLLHKSNQCTVSLSYLQNVPCICILLAYSIPTTVF